jgi:hypothetical protein
VVVAGLEGALRAVRSHAPGMAAARLEGVVLVAVAMTAAGGLALLLGGSRPHELLHFLYAVLALALLPVATSISARWEPRRRGFATVLGALIALAAVLRLFATG